MARVISGLRYARSFVTPSGAETISRVMDFDLGARFGISINWIRTAVIGIGNPTTDVNLEYIASVHLETDQLEDLPLATGEDENNIDTEVIHQHYAAHIHSESAAGLGAVVFQSNQRDDYMDLVVARNITFAGKSESASGSAAMALLMEYRYVELTNAELVGILTSRR